MFDRSMRAAARLSAFLTLGFACAVSAQAQQLDCEDGMAGAYPCHDVNSMAFMSIADLGGGEDVKAANVWGWTDPLTHREYALVGLTDATAFVDVTEPTAPQWLGSLPTQTGTSVYRDIKVHDDYAFIIADQPSLHGMQVFDLTILRDVANPPQTFSTTSHFDGFGDAHNFFINRDSGYAYVVRTTTPEVCGAAVTIVDIRNPLRPALAGCVAEGGLASDIMCVNYRGDDPDYQGREVCIVASDDDILIADVTDKAATVTLATVSYPDITRAHNAWLTHDHNYFISADMNDEVQAGLNTRIMVWDFRDVDAPELIGIYNGPTTASDHNVWVRGDRAFIGNFRAGVRILDLKSIASGLLSERAYFDMIPEDNNPGHLGGAWAVYAYFPSRLIAVTDKEAGLWLLHARPDISAELDYQYRMSDGSTGTGRYVLYDDASFADEAGNSGLWTLESDPAGLLMRHDAGAQCAAMQRGRPVAAGRFIGPRRCNDGSEATGFWSGTIVEPAVGTSAESNLR